MIDLHLHTTASDGRLTPKELVDAAAGAGLQVMAVTDHDTMDAVDEVNRLASPRGIEAISGIEVTAVLDGSDVHVLGYFADAAHPDFRTFLATQRQARLARVEEIGQRLAGLGMPVDIAALLAEARMKSGRSIGRPQVARAMVAAGYVADTREAFDRWLARDLPAFVPRTGASPAEVVRTLHEAGGLASIAHPGKSISDPALRSMVDAGLDAIEAFHPDHDADRVAHYSDMARRLGLLLTGGSDFHGDPSHGKSPGTVTLPAEEWRRLSEARNRYGG